jgi:hypothetical protein
VTGIPSPICFAVLFKKAFDGVDLRPLRKSAISCLSQSDPAAALMTLSIIDQLLGNRASGVAWQTEALRLRSLYRSNWHVSSGALRVLAFKAAGDFSTNTPIEFLLESSDVLLYSLYVVPGRPLPAIPEHDIAIVTVGESDRDRPVLREIERLTQAWPRPVLNHPARIVETSREGLYRLLRDIPGVVMVPTSRIGRADFAKLNGGAILPVIARPVGSHAGQGLAKFESAGDVQAYLAAQPGEEFYVAPYVDYRSADGQFRKYRLVWIDRQPYPCHMAIADQWKVWYYNAGMQESEAKRDEEEQFLCTFDKGFARRHSAALAAVAERLDLDYVGIDCAELPDGRLIVFEGDISLVAHDMDPPEIYPYKSRPAQKLFAAFYGMLKRKSGV